MRRLRPVTKALSDALCRLKATPSRRLGRSFARILISYPGHLGDMMLGLPVLAGVQASFPEARIELLANPRLGPLLKAALPDITVLAWEPAWFPARGARHGRGWLPPAAARRDRYDLCVDLRGELQSAIALRSIPAALRVGLDEFGSGWLLDASCAVLDGRPQAELLSLPFRLLRPGFEPRPDLLEAPFAPKPAGHRRRVIGLAPGAGSPSKRWPLERFRALISSLTSGAEPVEICLLGDASERSLALEGAHRDWRGSELDVDHVEALHDCAAIVSNDSLYGHLGALLGIPTVTVFSAANDVERWRPRGPAPSRLHHAPPPCADCRRRSCSHISCLTAIEVATVEASLRAILLQQAPHQASPEAPAEGSASRRSALP